MDDYLRFLNSVNNYGSSGILTYYPENLTTEVEEWTSKIKKYQEQNGKVMLLNPHNKTLDCSMQMSIDDVEGERLAAKFLIDANCTDFILVPPDFDSSYFNDQRDGFESVIEENNRTNRRISLSSSQLPNLLDEIKTLDATLTDVKTGKTINYTEIKNQGFYIKIGKNLKRCKKSSRRKSKNQSTFGADDKIKDSA